MRDLFLACVPGDIEIILRDPTRRGKFLVSYHYFKDREIEQTLAAKDRSQFRAFADCGAFSAFTQDVTIDIHEYADWCHKWGHLFDVIASLDVIGSAEASHENFETLRRLGVDCIPVFHVGDPWELLDQYIADNETYIALGGMVGNREANRFVDECFERTQDTEVGFHGFGMTKQKQMIGYPWRSLDSSTWSRARFGETQVYDPAIGRLVKVKAKTPEVLEMARLIEDHGGDPLKLYDSSIQPDFRVESLRVSTEAWRRMGEALDD